MPRRFRTLTLSLLAATVSVAGTAQADVALYDVDFGSPPHTVGAPPVVGYGLTPRDTPTSINDGTPTVQAAVGALAAQPLMLDSTDGDGDQVGFDLTEFSECRVFYFRSEVLVSSVGLDPDAELAFLFDTPAVRTVRFLGDGSIDIFVPGEPAASAAYAVDTRNLLEVTIDLNLDFWQIRLNSSVIHSGSFGGATALDEIRVGTDVAAPVTAMTAGIDNLRITGIKLEDCDRTGFNDLPLGKVYTEGDVFVSGGVTFKVGPHYFNLGPCGGGTTSGFARVENGGVACGTGHELQLNNVSLDIDFGTTVSDVVFQYADLGGTVNLGINGDCQVVNHLRDLDGAFLGGVFISVFEFGPGCGVVRLSGEVDQLLISGQEFWLDRLSWCVVCEDILRSTFEDRVLGESFNVGDSFVSNDASHELIDYYWPGPDCSIVFSGGVAQIQNSGLACANNNELALNNINDRIKFPTTVDWLTLSYGEYGGNINITINGDCRNADNFSDLNGLVIGGVRFFAFDYGIPGNSCGKLYAVGPIDEFVIGGQELWIDNIRACPPEEVPSDVDFEETATFDGASTITSVKNSPNPVRSRTWIGFALESPGRVVIDVFDVGGRNVARLADTQLDAGTHRIEWDGTGLDGRRLSTGIYTYRVQSQGAVRSRQLLLMN